MSEPKKPGFTNTYTPPETIIEADADLAEMLRLTVEMAKQSLGMRPRAENFWEERKALEQIVFQLEFVVRHVAYLMNPKGEEKPRE